MDATLYTGNGANRSITNAASFRPDFVCSDENGCQAWEAVGEDEEYEEEE